MKIERTKRRGKGELTLEITPLIDVVFLLLIFFLVATTFEDINSGIKIELPQSTIREIKDIKEIQIAIDKNKNMVLNYKEKGKTQKVNVNKENLKAELEEKFKNSNEKNVVISADKKLDYGYIVEIMTISKEAGASSLDIDTASSK
ncbi:biopolymer transporter ExbD [uncultured Fusobacterium sp.]|jgi:biopolymer transport protein ExbD|uniref:ExbD/TolR family protein n=1 Tax=uncultured Fusobacterium sp. TaxID=159267 RepID=UPI0025F89613|nr:biopolymer transporter ExbD [uncultured Fusobacterium sp.]MCF2639004.1 biopolymer transporter ExbD [Fusobacterium varium]